MSPTEVVKKSNMLVQRMFFDTCMNTLGPGRPLQLKKTKKKISFAEKFRSTKISAASKLLN